MPLAMLAIRLTLAGGVALLMTGATLAWCSVSVAKRLAGVALALMGAVLGIAATRAPETMMIAGTAVLFVYVAIGVSVLVRLQEGYASTEVNDIDRADEDLEPAEPAA